MSIDTYRRAGLSVYPYINCSEFNAKKVMRNSLKEKTEKDAFVRVKVLIRHSSGKKGHTKSHSQDRRHPDHKSDAVLPQLTWTKEFLWNSAISYGNIGPHADMPSWYRFKPI